MTLSYKAFGDIHSFITFTYCGNVVVIVRFHAQIE